MIRACTCCGQPFEADRDWKFLCLACWRARKEAEAGDIGAIALRGMKAELELAQARDRILELEERVREVIREARLHAGEARPEPIPDDMLKVLLLLAHPDRHGNSPASNRATTWLLQQRRKSA